MTAEDFAKLFYSEKQDLLRSYTTGSETLVFSLVKEMKLTHDQQALMKKAIDAVLTDTFYTVLLGLDGAASIGGVEEDYVIRDESGTILTGGGDIEAHAYDLFHGQDDD